MCAPETRPHFPTPKDLAITASETCPLLVARNSVPQHSVHERASSVSGFMLELGMDDVCAHYIVTKPVIVPCLTLLRDEHVRQRHEHVWILANLDNIHCSSYDTDSKYTIQR